VGGAGGAPATESRPHPPREQVGSGALGHNYIGTEHILLGLLRDPDAPGARLLAELGVTPAETKVRLTELLTGYTKPPAAD
jgi:ATP-dependent Clp protease ATP-binding subunit ClpA